MGESWSSLVCSRAIKITSPERALPVQGLPVNNYDKVGPEMGKVNSADFELSKFAVANVTGWRLAELWADYKDLIPVDGDEHMKFKKQVDSINKLMVRLRSSLDLPNQATEVHESYQVGDKTFFFNFGLKPGRQEGTYNVSFCFIETKSPKNPEQLVAFLLNNNTIGYDENKKTWNYMLMDDRDDLCRAR